MFPLPFNRNGLTDKCMQIDKVRIHQVVLPFSGDFSHSRKKRGYSAKNIIVEVIADHGEIRGYGEGAPRVYVTGESQESAGKSVVRFVKKYDFPWEVSNVSQIWDFLDGLPNIKAHKAAICALEMSLIDALGKSENRSVIQYFPKKFYTSKVYYGAAIPLVSKERIIEICKLIVRLGISHLRIKMGKDINQNRNAVEIVKVILKDVHDLRVDANGAWDKETALSHIPLLKQSKVKIIEQPMMPGDREIADFANAIKSQGIILMADESACTLNDVKKIGRQGHYKMINVRLSKCGGIRNSLSIIDYLRAEGLFFQVGCQLGESGILSAAGRILSLLCRDAVYHDGSYDGLLLKENITRENVSFGPGGEAGPLGGPGLGVEVDSDSLARLTDSSTIKTISRP